MRANWGAGRKRVCLLFEIYDVSIRWRLAKEKFLGGDCFGGGRVLGVLHWPKKGGGGEGADRRRRIPCRGVMKTNATWREEPFFSGAPLNREIAKGVSSWKVRRYPDWKLIIALT